MSSTMTNNLCTHKLSCAYGTNHIIRLVSKNHLNSQMALAKQFFVTCERWAVDLAIDN